MRIAFVIRSLGVGGAERQLVHLASGLAACGHQVSVITFYGGGPLEIRLRDMGVEVLSLKKVARWDLVRPAVRMHRLLRSLQPEVLHGYMPAESLAALMLGRLAKVPLVVWGIRASSLDGHDYGITTGAVYAMQSRLASKADLIISNSQAGLAGLKGVRAGQAVVVPNGIDCERFRPDLALRAQGRERLGVTEHERLIAMIGRIDPMKGHEVFLRAAARCLRSKTYPLRFVVAGNGGGPYRDRLIALTSTLGIAAAVEWVPAVDDPEVLYNAADLIVSSSLFGEGFSNVIAEALACGRPVVATRVGDANIVVPSCDRIVPAGDADSLAQAIAAAMDDPVDRSAERHVWIERHFGLAQLIDRTEILIRGCLERSRIGLPQGSISRS